MNQQNNILEYVKHLAKNYIEDDDHVYKMHKYSDKN